MLYDFLLRLYPARYTALFADEMRTVFHRNAEERRQSGWLSFALFVSREIAGAFAGAASEWTARLARPGRYLQASAIPQPDLPEDLAEAQLAVQLNIRRMEHAIATHQFEQARFYSREEDRWRQILNHLRNRHNIDAPNA